MSGSTHALPLHPERDGTLVVRLGEQDRNPEPRTAADGGQVWSWSWGLLAAAPSAVAAVRSGDDQLSFPYTTDLEGFAPAGRLRFVAGRSDAAGVVMLRDSLYTLTLSGGIVMEASADTIAVRIDPLGGDSRAGIIMFLGIMLLTALLLWNTRRRVGSP